MAPEPQAPASAEVVFTPPMSSLVRFELVSGIMIAVIGFATLASRDWIAAGWALAVASFLFATIVGQRKLRVAVSRAHVRLVRPFSRRIWAAAEIARFETDAAWKGAPLRFSTVILILNSGDQFQLIGPPTPRGLLIEYGPQRGIRAGLGRARLSEVRPAHG